VVQYTCSRDFVCTINNARKNLASRITMVVGCQDMQCLDVVLPLGVACFLQVRNFELRKGQTMYASVRQYTINPGQGRVDEAARDVHGGLGPILSQAPGFVAYYVLDAGNNNIVAISIFESQAAAEAADSAATG
jgi:hypothetical protein